MWLEKDDNEDPYNRQNGTPKPASVGSGSGGGAPVGAGEGNQTVPTPAGTSSTAQVPEQKQATVQDYLGANKAQGNQLGQQFQSKLNDVGAKDTKTIDDAASNVKSQAAAGTTAYDPNVVNSAFNDPTKTANDPNKLQSFLKQWNASYTGPASFESTNDFNAANSAATDAKTHGTEVGDAGGRKQILQDDFGVYGQGNKGLDHTLLQNSDNFGQVLETGKSLSSLPDYLSKQAQGVDAATSKAADTSAATKKNTQDLFSNSLTNFQTSLNNKVTSDQAQAASSVNSVKADLASGDVTKIMGDLSKSNLTPDEQHSIQQYLSTLNQNYNAKPDLNNYYTYNPNTDINKDTAASKDDYAKAAALQKLTGQDYSGVLNPTNISKADTWNQQKSGYNAPSIQAYLKSTLGQHDKELLAHNNVSDAATKLGMPDPTKNPADVTSWSSFAQKLIEAAQRTGTKADFGTTGVGHAVNPIGQLVDTLNQQLTGLANANMNSGGLRSPNVRGMKAAVDMLKSYFNY